jgi:predicted TIM-barrel fold metal-dependent hydrolase
VTFGLRGLKLVPSGWYPYDDCAHRVYERAAALNLPFYFIAASLSTGAQVGSVARPSMKRCANILICVSRSRIWVGHGAMRLMRWA